MNPRIPYNPDRRRTGQGDQGGGCGARLFWLLVPALALAFYWGIRTGNLSAAIAALSATPNPATVTAAAAATPVPIRPQASRTPAAPATAAATDTADTGVASTHPELTTSPLLPP